MFTSWYTLVFLIPLGVGMILALATATGMADLHHGMDVDGDAHVDHDHSHDAAEKAGFSVLGFLGFGKVPVLLIAMCWCLVFGGAGIALNGTIGAPGVSPGVPTGTTALYLANVAVAGLLAFGFTGMLARLVARLMPSLETAAKSKADLVGSTGTVLLLLRAEPPSSTNPKTTWHFTVEVRKDGDVHSVWACSDAPLPKGASVLITDYDAATNMYAASKDPLGPEGVP